jgi:hypothetical protein
MASARTLAPLVFLIAFANALAGPTPELAPIGKAYLEQARALLGEARNELSPRHSELLDRKLTEAERAFERFNRVASASGKAAEVARGAEGAARAGRASRPGGGVGATSGTGPLLLLLLAVWPAGTIAGPEHDRPPEWLAPQMELEARLRELSEAAEQVRAELEAAQTVPLEAAKRNRPPRPNEVTIRPNWNPESGEPELAPCEYKGSGGDGPSQIPGWIRCTYVCGMYVVKLHDVWGASSEDCKKAVHLIRARKEAENKHRVRGKDQ